MEKYEVHHLARIFGAKYGVTFAEGFCIAAGFFDIASRKEGASLIRDSSYVEGALRMLFAQERIDETAVNDIRQSMLRIANQLPSGKAEAELQSYIMDIYADALVDAIQRGAAEVNNHE